MGTPAEATSSHRTPGGTGRPGELRTPVVRLSLSELATVAMLVEGAHTMNSDQSRMALAREEVLESALRQLKLALVEAGAVQDGPGWRPRSQ